MIDTLSDTQLEIEYAASCLLCLEALPSDYLSLKFLISSIKVIDTSEFHELPYDDLTSLTDKLGLLKDTEIQKYYIGKADDLFMKFENLKLQASALIPIYENKIIETFNTSADKLYNQLPDAGYLAMGSAIDSVGADTFATQNYDKVKFDLQQLDAQLSHILELYGSGEKFSTKHKSPKWDKKYMIYLQELQTEIDKFTDNPQLTMTIGFIVDSIGSLNPVTSQDPYSMDLLDNLLMVLQNPKDYYKDCHMGKILNEVIGKLFYHCYPAFFNKFADIYIEDFESMDYTDQQNFRNCFGMKEDNSQLINAVAPTMVFTQPGAQ